MVSAPLHPPALLEKIPIYLCLAAGIPRDAWRHQQLLRRDKNGGWAVWQMGHKQEANRVMSLPPPSLPPSLPPDTARMAAMAGPTSAPTEHSPLWSLSPSHKLTLHCPECKAACRPPSSWEGEGAQRIKASCVHCFARGSEATGFPGIPTAHGKERSAASGRKGKLRMVICKGE